MNLITKTISVGDRELKSAWTVEMFDDLMNMGKSFRYKLEDQSEKLILEQYFKLKLMEMKLSSEMAKEIDKEILKSLISFIYSDKFNIL